MKILFAVGLPTNELRKIGTGQKELINNYEHFLFPLISWFKKTGNEVVIVSTDRSISKNEIYKQDGLTIHIVAIQRHGNISATLKFRNDIRNIEFVIRKEKADVLNAHWCYEYAEACLRVDASKTIVTVHDWPDIVCSAIGNYYWKQRNKLGNNVLAKAEHFIAVSQYIADRISMKNIGANITTIPNYLCNYEISLFEKFIDKKKDDSRLFRVITVDNGFNGIKNNQVAIRAFENFHKSFPNSEMKMYGFDYEPNGIAYKWANDNNICLDGISFIGAVCREEIPKIFGRADLFLHTSIEESFGLVYLEAMASRTPIVAGNNSGATPWVLQDVQDVVLVNVNSVESVINGMKQIYNTACNMDYRKRLNEFDFRNACKMYEELYFELKGE